MKKTPPAFSFLQFVFFINALLLLSSCGHNNMRQLKLNQVKVVAAKGYVVPEDSLAQPKVIFVDESKLKKVQAGKPEVIVRNSNIFPAGKPKVVLAGIPLVVTPGTGSFSQPETVPAIDHPFLSGIPEVIIANEMGNKDQNPENFSFFGILQGLKNRNIICSFEDDSGNIWFGTSGGGASKYNGKSFTHFTMKEGLSNNIITAIIEDKSGNIWFGTNGGGVTKYNGRTFTHFTEKEGLSNNFVFSILEDTSGNIWFGAIGSVSKYDGKSFTHYKGKESFSNCYVNAIMEDKSGIIWFGTGGNGVIRYDGKIFTQFTVKEGLSDHRVRCILEDRVGNIWIGTGGNGVTKYDGKNFTHFTESEGLINNNISSILEDKSGNIWFGSGRGVTKYDGKNFLHFTVKEGLSNNQVHSMLEDRSGNLWFTTFSGVSKYSGRIFTHFTDKEGLSNNYVRSVLQDRNGNLWFGTFGGGVTKYDGKVFSHYTMNQGLNNNQINAIAEDKSGNLWFGTSMGGITKYDGKSFTFFTEKDGLSSDNVLRIIPDKSGNLWFGTGGGVSKYDGKSFTNFTREDGLSSNQVHSILEDKSGNLWFGTNGGGVTEYDGKNFIHFTEKEGLSGNDVYSILEDKSGNLWFGTMGGGLTKFDGISFTHLTEKEGLSNNYVGSILEDRNGNLWFGTRFGLSKFSKEKSAIFSDKVKLNNVQKGDIYFKNYNYDDGFLGIACNNNSIWESKDGTIWIGTNERLTAFHPEGEIADTIAPNIQLTSLELFNENIDWAHLEQKQNSSFLLGNGVRVGNFKFDGISKWYNLPEHLSLAYKNNYLTFNFIGITMVQSKNVKYQYKLEGMDDNWSAVSSSNNAPYGNLSQGTYTFRVKAMNSEGYWSPEYNYTFTIRPPWWKTLWAYGFYMLLSVATAYAAFRIFHNRLLQKEKERNRILELGHAKEIEKAYTELKVTQKQLIQSEKMASLGELTAGIAHEIQNPLNFINNFSSINAELIYELQEELKAGEIDDAILISNNIKENEQKIAHHGKRADAIVKGMLQHSRSSSGIKEPADINVMADEYLRLSYHGLRAKDKTFNATIKTDFDPAVGKINLVPQEIGRVILNLINNAFYAVTEKKKLNIEGYEPVVSISTNKSGEKVEIRVSDNGTGIPLNFLDKIFQPFFTTKPTGQGTGLGLSLSYDIVTKGHGGELKVETREGDGSVFIIQLPYP
jgi:ligand-binding sensor domain-containing protein/signal transduction histidine kinase